MFHKQISKVLLSFVAALMLLSNSATALWAATPGDGPDSALTPSSAWISLAPGESRWYLFHYDYDQERDVATDVTVRLEMTERDSAGFEVWTPGNVRQWINQEEDWEPTGAGTKLSNVTDDEGDETVLVWSNRGSVSETFYVIVRNQRMQPTQVKLTVTGENLSFPSQLLDVGPSSEPEGKQAANDAPSMATDPLPADVQSVEFGLDVAGGTGPDDALSTLADSGQLVPGAQRWYRFHYDDGRTDDDDSPETAQVRLQMAEVGCLAFAVWTPRNIQQWIHLEEDWEPVGSGSVLDYAANDGDDDDGKRDEKTLVWLGSAAASETFYVIVENTGTTACDYTLRIEGATVSY